MRRRSTFALPLTVILWAGCGSQPSATSGQARRARVLEDRFAILDADSQRRIGTYLLWVGEQYGIDYHVVIAPSDGVPLERRAPELFAERKVGSASAGKGLLLLLDPPQRSVRVEVGYALEPYVTDVAASRMLSEYLAPRSGSGVTPAGIEAAIEALVDTLRPHLEPTAPDTGEPSTAWASGGGGARLERLGELPEDGSDVEDRSLLRTIAVPQPDPRQARDLEIALLHRGVYVQEATLYDAAWRAAARSGTFPPARLREIARQFDRPYEVAIEGSRAVAYYPDAPALGPVFLRRDPEGWVIDASEGARTITYDYSNTRWYARDQGSPYLALLRGSLELRPVTLSGGGAAWTLP